MDKEPCIYKIKNLITNKIYIGSSCNGLTRRKRVHISNLSNNKHHSNKLQHSYNKYGIENFIFEIIEYCTKYEIIDREQYWIDYFDSYINGYNCTPLAKNCTDRPVTLETRLKISNSLKGVKHPRTKEHDLKLSESKMKPVLVFDLDNNYLNEYGSANEAANKCGVSQSVVSSSCNNKRKCKTYIFKYKNNE